MRFVQVQAPAVQFSPEGHRVPQAPQLFGSVCVFTQRVPHMIDPAAQHAPFVQVPPPGQTVVQAPQWFESVFKLTHVCPHSVKPLAGAFGPHS
jgi:hypothetical protein